MRFDDSLTTVLASATTTDSATGAQIAWRQLVDLAGQGRGDPAALIARLTALRDRVSLPVRVASARGLAGARPPAALVAFMAEDEIAVAAPVLRGAVLPDDEWLALLPRLSPRARAVLRHRRDLPDAVLRGLASFGPTDFVLAHAAPEAAAAAPSGPAPVPDPPSMPDAPAPRFEIADLVARIDAFQRTRPAFDATPVEEAPADQFRFATDAIGVIRWVDGVARGPLVGVTLARPGRQGMAEVDAITAAALARRAPFRDARLVLGGESMAAGTWTIAGSPIFEHATGRFAGVSGIARRISAPVSASGAAGQLRQLVHELRTPATAIAGFAELIGSELLGPVAPVYRDRARLIERQAGELVGAIEDLDTAARLEGGALTLRPETVELGTVVERAVDDLRTAAAAKKVTLDVALVPASARVDLRATERLIARLLATVVTVAAPGERLRVQVTSRTRTVRLAITRPRGLTAAGQDRLLSLAPEPAGEGPLLGLAFSLRLFGDLAAAMGGRFAVEPDRLTLRLPLAHVREVAEAGSQ